MFKFEKLEVWQKAVFFGNAVYKITMRFPDGERFGLTMQLRRAAVSVAANIAEGCARKDADFARFLSIASGSLYEVVTQTKIAQLQGFLANEDYSKLYEAAQEIARMLSGLKTALTVKP